MRSNRGPFYMQYIAIDTETDLIRPGNLTPALTCVTFSTGKNTCIKNHIDGPEEIERLLPDNYLVGHNIAYDLAVLMKERPSLKPLIWKAYDEDRISDTKIREQLIDIYMGRRSEYDLKSLVERYNLGTLEKENSPRLDFGRLRGVPFSEWPREHLEYAKTDALKTYQLLHAQAGSPNLADEAFQCRAAWALHLMSCKGLHTNPETVAQLANKLTDEYASLQADLVVNGFFHVTGTKKVPKLAKNTDAVRARVIKFYEQAPKTASDKIAIDADTLTRTGDPLLLKLVRFGEVQKLLKTYVPVLKSGTEVPINARYNVLVASGRTSCSAPNLQNLPRGDGVRECFVPSDGNVFVTADYEAIEMRCLAQLHLWMFRRSSLVEALRDGKDLHLQVAAQLLGLSYDAAVAAYNQKERRVVEARQISKIANYGFAGGMSARTFVEYARAAGLKITLQQALKVRNAFFNTWKEMDPYLKEIEYEIADDARLMQFQSRRVRGGLTYTSAANTLFQGLCADGAKAALYAVSKNHYLNGFAGCPVAFLHDEILVETPKGREASVAQELAATMEQEMKRYLPSVPVKAEARVLGEKWTK